MPWGAIVGSVVGGLIGSDASRSAANTQADAARAATDLQKKIYDETVTRNQPFYQGGLTGLNALTAGVTNGTFGQAPTMAQVQAEPGYQFGLDQGLNALNRQYNAAGLRDSGAVLKAATRYGTDYASQQYGNAFNRALQGQQQAYNQLSGLAGLGQQAANNTSAYGSQFGSQAGQNMLGAANAQAANSLAQGNIWGNVINQGISAYNNRPGQTASIFSPGGSAGSGFGSGSYFGNQDLGSFL